MSLFLKHLVVVSGLLAGEVAHAEPVPAEQRGLEIFTELDRRSSDFRDLVVDLKMILRTASGKSSERDLHILQLEVPDDGDKIMVVFLSPASIRGTALLSHAHKVGTDDQWLFLPALQRVKKVAARNKSGSFVGSEFSFEDLSAQELTKYRYEYLRDEQIAGQAYYVVARYPLDEYSGYSREIFWLDQNEYRTTKVEYYDQQMEASKILELSDYQQYVGRIWKAHRMVMTNLRTLRSTELQWGEYRFDNGLTAERDLSVAGLRRVR